jgi:hypothetical protein
MDLNVDLNMVITLDTDIIFSTGDMDQKLPRCQLNGRSLAAGG